MIHRLLQNAADVAPATPCLVGAPRSFTYAEAAAEASRLRDVLRRTAVARLGIYAHDSPRSVLLLAGCAAAGIDACVLSRDWPAADIAAPSKRFELPVVVTDSHVDLPDVRVIPIGSLFDEPQPHGSVSAVHGAEGCGERPTDNLHNSQFRPLTPALSPEYRGEGDGPSTQSGRRDGTTSDGDARLLILTSGTTGVPKAAWYTWDRLVAQAKVKPEWAGTRWLLAYHLNHFAGLHLLAHVLANGTTLVIPSSPALADAAAAMIEHDVQCVSGTPTFWRLLLAELDRDRARALPVQQVTLGGEAVPPDLPGKLRDYFPNARVSQVFATTEAGSCFSVRDGRDGFPAAVLEPSADAPARAKVVDGELHVLSEHGMLGYFGEPAQQQEEQHHADVPEPNWLATGDLVEVRGDRVHFVGRKSEVINVGGVKVHALPVEQLVQAVPGVRAAHCYGRRNPVTGQVVALDIVPEPGADRAALETAIRAACDALPRHARPQLVRFVDRLETVNYKVLRRPADER